MTGRSLELVWVVGLLALLLGVYVVARLAARRRRRQPLSSEPGIDALPPDPHVETCVELVPPSSLGEPFADNVPAAVSTSSTLPAIVLERPSPTRYPIVFAHGWMGFDTIGLPGLRSEYFRGVRQRLEALGYTPVFVRVSPTASVEVRAQQLAEQILKIEVPRVNIVAHSMGGLDARYAISRLGLRGRVASLTTIGTPHRGTPLADTSTGLIMSSKALRGALSAVGIDGLYDLTTRQMDDFNRAIADVPDVTYTSVVGSVSGGFAAVHAMLAPGYAYLLRRAGANDGIVPAYSQPWGEVLSEIDADHWAQIGWSRGFDSVSFYATLAERLSRRGL